MLLAERRHKAAGCPGMDLDPQLVLAQCWLIPGRASDTSCGNYCLARAHTDLCHASLCHVGLSEGVQQPWGHTAVVSSVLLQPVLLCLAAPVLPSTGHCCASKGGSVGAGHLS